MVSRWLLALLVLFILVCSRPAAVWAPDLPHEPIRHQVQDYITEFAGGLVEVELFPGDSVDILVALNQLGRFRVQKATR